uniref:Uncharacterized protein n=1 Tax=Branchiostoma floridae TaxID=7739 RepID=C3YC86_BRAFL|eukprot:XP_002606108.1 hypothetical protein BRAFLDRAFT_88018 [Branchiostoma floridae]
MDCRRRILLLLLAVVSQILQNASGSAICPSGYTSHGTMCYKAFSTAANFHSARQTCAGESALLAMPRDAETNNFLMSFVSAGYQWIGLSDEATEGRWVWEDGAVHDLEDNDYNNWGSNEPNGGTHESCASLRRPQDDWNDAGCSTSYQFACETDADECAVANGNCRALQVCVNSVGSFSCLCNEGYMLNSTTLECDDINECASSNGGCEQICTNSDGGYQCSCADQYVLNENEQGCDVCRNPLGMESGAIPDGSITASSTWGTAHEPYRARLNGVAGVGAWAARLNVAGEWLQVDLGEVLRVTGTVTQGRNNNGQWVMSFKLEYSTDGTTMTTCTGKDGPEKIFPGNTDYNTPVTHLLDYPIDARYVRFHILQWWAHISMRVEILGCNVNQLACLDGYSLHGLTCYKAFDQLSNYNDAREACVAEGGMLAMPKDDATNSFLYSLASSGSYWIGLNDKENEGQFHWEDGDLLGGGDMIGLLGDISVQVLSEGEGLGGDFNNWIPGEPSGSHADEDCAHFRDGVSLWGDSRCSFSYNYFCQTKPDIDECASSNGGCEHICTNSAGGYQCSCAEGYAVNPDDDRNCDDINECETANGGCAQTCSNTDGGFNCACGSGYTLGSDGLSCNDIDECETANGGCAQACANTDGGFNCVCGSGYTLGSDGLSCHAECLSLDDDDDDGDDDDDNDDDDDDGTVSITSAGDYDPALISPASCQERCGLQGEMFALLTMHEQWNITFAASPADVFETAEVVAEFGDETGPVVLTTPDLQHAYSLPGKYHATVTAYGKGFVVRAETVVLVLVPDLMAELDCDSLVHVGHNGTCTLMANWGTSLNVTAHLHVDPGHANLALADAAITTVGVAMPNDVQVNSTNDDQQRWNVGTFVIPASQFSVSGNILAWEFHARRTGTIELLVHKVEEDITVTPGDVIGFRLTADGGQLSFTPSEYPEFLINSGDGTIRSTVNVNHHVRAITYTPTVARLRNNFTQRGLYNITADLKGDDNAEDEMFLWKVIRVAGNWTVEVLHKEAAAVNTPVMFYASVNADSGVPESGMQESGVTESGMQESGVTESGMQESGVPESGMQESGVTESGMLESGSKTDPMFSLLIDGQTIYNIINMSAMFTHTFTSIGMYEITVIVSDDAGNTTNTSQLIMQEPVSNLRLSGSTDIPLNVASAFNVTADSGSDLSCLLDFGDGSTDTLGIHEVLLVEVSHSFDQPGSFEMNITCSNNISSANTTLLVDVAGVYTMTLTVENPLQKETWNNTLIIQDPIGNISIVALNELSFVRNKAIVITADLEIKCVATSQNSKNWSAIQENTSTGQVIQVVDLSRLPSSRTAELLIPANYLNPDLHRVSLCVELNPELTNRIYRTCVFTYIVVTAAPLQALLFPGGTSQIVLGADQSLNLNPNMLSIDLDDSGSSQNFTTFTWFCKPLTAILQSRFPPIATINLLKNFVLKLDRGMQVDLSAILPQQSGSFVPTLSDPFDIVSGGCFNSTAQGNVSTASLEQGRLSVEGSMLVKDVPLVFAVVTWKASRFDFAKLVVIVKDHAGPVLSISCVQKSQCTQQPSGQKINPSTRLVIQASCEIGCGQVIRYRWTLKQEESSGLYTEISHIPGVIYPARRGRYFVVEPLALEAALESNRTNATYVIELEGWNVRRPRLKGQSTMFFQINTPPTPGTCEVSPVVGMTLQDTFTLNCTGWYDEDGIDRYQIYVRENSSVLASELNNQLNVGATKTGQKELNLPAGNAASQYQWQLYVTVQDTLGAYVNWVVGTIQQRKTLIKSMTSLPMTSIGHLQKLTSVISSATAVPQEVTRDSQASSLSLNSSRAESGNSTKVGNEGNSTETTNMAVLGLLDKVMSTVTTNVIPGIQVPKLVSSTLVVSIERNLADEVDKSAEIDGSQFALPDRGLFNDIGNESVVDTRAVTFKTNPYSFRDIEGQRQLRSDVFMLEHVVGDSKLNVSGLQDPISIVMQKNLDGLNTEYVYPRPTGPVMLHKYNISGTAQPALHVDIAPDVSGITYTVYVSFDHEPNITNPYLVYNIDDMGKDNGFYRLFVDPDLIPEDNNGTVYVGIQEEGVHTVSPTADYAPFSSNYSLLFYVSQCIFWNDTLNDWDTTGCKVGDASNSTHTQCLCNHLTSFASDLFVPPNPIDFSYVFANASFMDNITTYVTIITIYVIFVIGAIWARRMDKRDIEMVSIVLNGERGESGARQLEDPKRRVLRRGGKDSFLLSTARPLGNLMYMRVWHDNSGGGGHASWFLRHIVVRDVLTGAKYMFIGNCWLAVEKGDGRVSRLLPVAGREQALSFQHLFTLQVQHCHTCIYPQVSRLLPVAGREQALSFQHLFTSKFIHCHTCIYPQVSRLLPVAGREQVLFFQHLFTSKFIHCHTCIYPQVSRLLPVAGREQVLFFQHLFTSKFIHCHTCIYPQVSRLLPVAGREQALSFQHLFTSKFIHCHTCIYPQVSRLLPVAGREQALSFQHLFTSNIVIHVSILREQALSFQHLFTSKTSKDLEDEHIWFSVFLRPPRSRFTRLQRLATCLSLLMCAMLVSAMWYGILPDQPSSNAIRIGPLILSAEQIGVGLMSNLITFPINLIIVQLFRKSRPRRKRPSRVMVALEQQETEKTTCSSQVVSQSASCIPKPSQSDDHTKKDSTKKKKRKFSFPWWGIIVAWILVFLAVGTSTTFVIFYGIQFGNETATKWITSMVVSFTSSVLVTQPIKASIKTAENFWAWAQGPLLDGLRPGPWYNQQPADNMGPLVADKISMLVGYAIIRQLRVREGGCEGPVPLLGVTCTSEYSWDNEDHGNYKPRWEHYPYNQSIAIDVGRLEYSYTQSGDIESYPVEDELQIGTTPSEITTSCRIKNLPGIMAIYTGGGYVVHLDGTKEELVQRMQQLQQEGCRFLLEVLPSGNMMPSYNISPVRLLSYYSSLDTLKLVCQVTYFGFLLYFMYRELRELCRDRTKYFADIWNWMELFVIAVSIAAIVAYFYKMVVTNSLLDDLARTNGRDKTYVNLQYVSGWNQLYEYLVSCLVYATTLKLFRLLRFNRRMSLLSATIRHSSKELTGFATIIGVLFMSFSMLGYLVLGIHLKDFSSFVDTLETLVGTTMGYFEVDEIIAAKPFMGTILFVSFSVSMAFVILNVFVGILTTSFEEVRKENDKQANDYEIVDFMLGVTFPERIDQFVSSVYRLYITPQAQQENAIDDLEYHTARYFSVGLIIIFCGPILTLSTFPMVS